MEITDKSPKLEKNSDRNYDKLKPNPIYASFPPPANQNQNIEFVSFPSLDEEKYYCSYFGFKPEWLQKYANVKTFAIINFIYNIQFGLFFIYLVINIVNLERHFHLQSKWTGFILSSYEIGFIVAILPISFFAGQHHRPRWMAAGSFGIMIACVLFTLPYFLYGTPKRNLATYSPETDFKHQLCNPNSTTPIEECINETNHNALGILIFSIILIGCCSSTVSSLAIPYLDDNSPGGRSALYIALAMSSRVFGPVFAFLLASLTGSFYVDLSDPGFAKDSVHWIGAWWLGFLIMASVFPITCTSYAGFPIKLNQSSVSKSSENVILHSDKSKTEKKPNRIKIKDLPRILGKLLKNSVLMSRISADTCTILGTVGFLSFLAKYVENHFQLSSYRANMMVGPVLMLGTCIGYGSGGFIVHTKRITFKRLLLLIIVANLVWSGGHLILIIFSCTTPKLLNNWKNGSMCDNCHCLISNFDPVCEDETQTAFFSPCHAGCTSYLKFNKTFLDCSCQSLDGTLKEGLCLSQCSTMYGYLVVFFFLLVISTLPAVGNTMVTLRSVPPELKNCAFGLEMMIIGLIGVIPSPIIYGYLTDSSCLVWESSCNEKGACKLYDSDMLRLRFHGTCAAINCLAFLPNLICYKKGKHLQFSTEDNKEIKK